MENIISSEEIMVDATQENVYVVNSNINHERIRKICRESDFAKVNLMREQNEGYLSNLNLMLTPALKDWLGMTDILDEEVYLICVVPHHYISNWLSGGFAVTKIGVFSAYFDGGEIRSSYIPFEYLAQSRTIWEGWPEYHMMHLQPQGTIAYHWLMVDDRQLAFFTYTDFDGSTHIINLFREIASSVRRDLVIGRVNISETSHD